MRVPILPPPGLNSDASSYEAPGIWRTGFNMRFFHGKPQTLGGHTALQSGAAETYSEVRKLLAYKISGTVNVAVAHNAGVYRVDSTTWARTDISPASGWTTNVERASLAMFGDVLLAVPHHLTPSSSGTLYTSTAGAQLASVANAPDNIVQMLVTPSRQVMALGCNEEVSTTFNGRCIRWSDIEDYTDWTTSSSNNAGEYILPGQDDIVAAGNFGDHIAIWTTGSFWLGQYIGQPGQTFIFTKIDNAGLVSADAWAIMHGVLYWMDAEYRVYSYRIGGLPVALECPIIRQFIEELGSAAGTAAAGSRQVRFAMANRRYGEIWFFYTVAGGSIPTRFLAYCVNESAAAQRHVWYIGRVGGTLTSYGAGIDDPLLTDATSMNDSTIILAQGTSSARALVAFDQDTGTNNPSYELQSSYYYLDEGQRRVQVQRLINDMESGTSAPTDNVTVTSLARDDPEDTSNEPTTSQILIGGSATAKIDFRLSGRLVSVKFAGSSRMRLGKPAFEVRTLGER